MNFTKMHGLGNDYIYVNGFVETVGEPESIAPIVADRHFGVGGDGLILIEPPESDVQADVRMRMFNADGSESEMCGNGIRCVAKYAHDHGLTTARPMRVQTGAGVLSLDYTLNDAGLVELVTVNMGQPRLAARQIPFQASGFTPGDELVDIPLHDLVQWPSHLAANWIDACGLNGAMTCVNMGNPHAVLYCDSPERIELEQVGPLLENHPMFPERVNVHFVKVHARDEVTVRTWERGSGMTLACGTGASAVCVAGVLNERTDRRITAHLPGGDLDLLWREEDNCVYMTGPATEVFHGEIALDRVPARPATA